MTATAQVVSVVAKGVTQLAAAVSTPTTLTVAVSTMPPVALTSSGFSLHDFVSPAVGAFFGAVLALVFGWMLKRLEELDKRRTLIRKAVVILAAYKEDLDGGYAVLDGLLTAIGKREFPDRIVTLSRGAWDNFRLETDFILELHLVKNQTPDGTNGTAIRTLPTKLKNCFEHTTSNYEGTIKKVLSLSLLLAQSDNWVISLGDDFTKLVTYRDAYLETANLTYAAIDELSKEVTVSWIERKLGYY